MQRTSVDKTLLPLDLTFEVFENFYSLVSKYSFDETEKNRSRLTLFKKQIMKFMRMTADNTDPADRKFTSLLNDLHIQTKALLDNHFFDEKFCLSTVKLIDDCFQSKSEQLTTLCKENSDCDIDENFSFISQQTMPTHIRSGGYFSTESQVEYDNNDEYAKYEAFHNKLLKMKEGLETPIETAEFCRQTLETYKQPCVGFPLIYFECVKVQLADILYNAIGFVTDSTDLDYSMQNVDEAIAIYLSLTLFEEEVAAVDLLYSYRKKADILEKQQNFMLALDYYAIALQMLDRSTQFSFEQKFKIEKHIYWKIDLIIDNRISEVEEKGDYAEKRALLRLQLEYKLLYEPDVQDTVGFMQDRYAGTYWAEAIEADENDDSIEAIKCYKLAVEEFSKLTKAQIEEYELTSHIEHMNEAIYSLTGIIESKHQILNQIKDQLVEKLVSLNEKINQMEKATASKLLNQFFHKTYLANKTKLQQQITSINTLIMCLADTIDNPKPELIEQWYFFKNQLSPTDLKSNKVFIANVESYLTILSENYHEFWDNKGRLKFN